MRNGPILGEHEERTGGYDGSPSLVKAPDLADDLDRALNELAEIIVEFYREWKQR